MTLRFLATTAACALAVAASGCGGGDSGKSPVKPAQGAPKPPNPNDKRGVALQCFRNDGLQARFSGDKSIQVGGNGGPRVEFFVSGGEAEGQQFDGKAQGAEQIGSALLFINQGTEDQLDTLEKCLDDQ